METLRPESSMNKGRRELWSLSEGLSWWSVCECYLVTANCVESIAENSLMSLMIEVS